MVGDGVEMAGCAAGGMLGMAGSKTGGEDNAGEQAVKLNRNRARANELGLAIIYEFYHIPQSAVLHPTVAIWDSP
jgi:hypothetical protein